MSHAAFLLGYAYFEAYLGDLVRAVLKCRPRKLGLEKTITVKELVEGYEAGTDVLTTLIEKEVRAIFMKSMGDVADALAQRLDLEVDHAGRAVFVDAGRIRNSLMHNGAIAAEPITRLGIAQGSRIQLSTSDVHDWGIDARRISNALWRSACDKHGLS